MKEIRKTIAKNLDLAQTNRDKLDPKNPLEATQWHRFDAVAAYLNTLIDIIDNMKIGSDTCKYDSNGCHFNGYCEYRRAPDMRFGNGLPRCGLGENKS